MMQSSQFLPSLSKLDEFERFLARHGEPFSCGLPTTGFRHACGSRPYDYFSEQITRWAGNSPSGPRHWPALAYTVDQYDFLSCEIESYGKKTSPAVIKQLLEGVHRNAFQLTQSLVRLHELSHRLSDGAKPESLAHLAYLARFIDQAAAGALAPELIEEPLALLGIDNERRKFLNRLVDVEVAAKDVLNRLDPMMLRVGRPAKDRALRQLVRHSAPIWQSLTARPPSVEKVHSINRDETPDYVLFVQELVRIGNLPPWSNHEGWGDGANRPIPSLRQVQTAFRPLQ